VPETWENRGAGSAAGATGQAFTDSKRSTTACALSRSSLRSTINAMRLNLKTVDTSAMSEHTKAAVLHDLGAPLRMEELPVPAAGTWTDRDRGGRLRRLPYGPRHCKGRLAGEPPGAVNSSAQRAWVRD
jgi:hypothetical protein